MKSTNPAAEVVSAGTANIFDGAIQRLENALNYVTFSDGISEILLHPEASLMVSIRVRMDDGSLKI
ncbi:MAG: hypothetical protein QGF68_21045, partial [Nitrospinota bacterium]|nr:hypothetical protein [Nitrospinota bacterium]